MDLISVIIPVHNGDRFLDECFDSIVNQDVPENAFGVEVSIYDDGSTDGTNDIIIKWIPVFMEKGFEFKRGRNTEGSHGGEVNDNSCLCIIHILK